MPAKAHPSTQAVGISTQLVFAWPEETALQKHPGMKREQDDEQGGIQRLTTRIKQILLLTIWLSHTNG